MTRRTEDTQTQLIPLNRLKKSPRNVRQTPHEPAHIKALADSIDVYEQIQNLVVETERDQEGRATGDYLVTAGEGRRLAQLLRVERGRIAEDEPIRCVLDDTHNAQAISLAENELRQQMHPADQYVAFKQLVDGGESIEDVAAHFGVTPLVVQRRLKLANLHPQFLDLYRRKEASLEMLMALALTDDIDKQQEVWNRLKANLRHPDTIRRALTENEISAREPIARFVGLKAYTKAGGGIRRDLFSDENEGFLTDTALIHDLATKKLTKQAKQLEANGAAWVVVTLQLDYAEFKSYGQVQTVERDPTEKEQVQLDALAKRRADIEAQAAEAEQRGDEDRLSALLDALDDLDAEEEALAEQRSVPDPEQQRVAGVIVTIDHDGKLRIEQGLLKPEDAKRFGRSAKVKGKANGSGAPRLHSEALMRRLTAHRTLALQAALAQRPDIALVALSHRFVVDLFYGASFGLSAIQIDADQVELRAHADDLPTSKAHAALEAQREYWTEQLPQDREQVWSWLLKRPESSLHSLLAFCVALTVNGVQSREGASVIDPLARAVCLDMREWWTPTAKAYFDSLPKARILAVVREAVSPEVATPLALLKKTSLATAAEEKVAGTGWLPEPLRTIAA